jgi:hypothetical protein
MAATIPSPAATGVKKLKDRGIGRYIEFPEDTIFMESLAQNSTYKAGVAYVPAQRLVEGKLEMHIYEITAKSTGPTHLMGPLQVEDTIELTVFGSALSTTGILYLSAFNRNSIIAIDLEQPHNPKSFLEIPDLPSPNDVCLDPDDESILYVAGGTFRNLCCCYEFSNPAYGKCYKVQLNDDKTSGAVSVQAEGMRTLAGIEKIGKTLWIAELFDVQTQNLEDAAAEPKVVWKGNNAEGMVWMADNIDIFDGGNYILCPAYSTVPESTVNNVLNRAFVLSTILFYLQLSTACMKGESFADAIQDPEVSLSFSNTYIQEGVDPAPVRLLFMKPGGDSFHFEVDLEETRQNNPAREIKDPKTGAVLGKRHFFNEQVTHAGHLVDPEDGSGFIACVNFEQPRILLLDDKPFKEAMTAIATAE